MESSQRALLHFAEINRLASGYRSIGRSRSPPYVPPDASNFRRSSQGVVSTPNPGTVDQRGVWNRSVASEKQRLLTRSVRHAPLTESAAAWNNCYSPASVHIVRVVACWLPSDPSPRISVCFCRAL
ncbi:hypothetical protein LSAT2_031605 [Lamellibrachia satsuma]|nr:hypothetical protein LSAT2_031605 [Lamellibrachia satsuma]